MQQLPRSPLSPLCSSQRRVLTTSPSHMHTLVWRNDREERYFSNSDGQNNKHTNQLHCLKKKKSIKSRKKGPGTTSLLALLLREGKGLICVAGQRTKWDRTCPPWERGGPECLRQDQPLRNTSVPLSSTHRHTPKGIEWGEKKEEEDDSVGWWWWVCRSGEKGSKEDIESIEE